MGVTGNEPRTVSQAAVELSLSKSTVRAWIATRKMGHLRLGRAIRVPASEIARLLETNYVPPERTR